MTATGNITADTYGLSMIVRDAAYHKEDIRPEVEKLLVELEGAE
jgi:hypothetical protein